MKIDLKKLPVQAQIVLAAGVLFALSESLRGSKFDPLMLVIGLLVIALITYNVRCLVRGKCGTWAWALAIAYVLSMAMTAVAPVSLAQ